MSFQRPMVVSIVVCAAFGCTQNPAGDTAGDNEQRQPNVVFILADDLGYGDLGLYGSEIIETPTSTPWAPRACASRPAT